MKCVIDANILIDLSNGEILSKLFALALDVSTPDAVLDEMIEPDRSTLQHMGLGTITLSPTQLLETARMHAEDARLSLGDCAALIAARDERVFLLTGDKRLKDRAEEVSLETHGVLWILDEIEAAELLSHAELAVSPRNCSTKGPGCPPMNASNVFCVGQVKSSCYGNRLLWLTKNRVGRKHNLNGLPPHAYLLRSSRRSCT